MKENVNLTRYVANKLSRRYPRLKGSKVLIYRTPLGSYRHELFPPKGVRITKNIKHDWEEFCNEARLRYDYDKPTKTKLATK